MKTVNLKSLVAATLVTGICAGSASAATWEVTITNLTHGNHFTPLFLRAHDSNTHLFQVGEKAAADAELMAECGDNSLLVTSAGNGNFINNPANGFLNPGANTKTTITTAASGETHLSVVSMILPTNDAFIGMDAQQIPAAAGTYTYYINGYDAGTESNDEILNAVACDSTTLGMPGAPGADADSGATGVAGPDTNTNIHIHRGTLGEATATASGSSDLLSTIHRWQNPVAEITVTVTP